MRIKKYRRDRKLVEQAKERDFYICQKCGCSEIESGLEVHHIHPLYVGGEDKLENMITLCGDCHERVPNEPEKFDDFYNKPFCHVTEVFMYNKALAENQPPNIAETAELEWRTNGNDISKRRKVVNGVVVG